ncbi:MAG: hypothetical protein HZA94_02200 [Candidatus Vogelbacteria bacterium]|nr:hypothetical protein [Candidatus Vogelbacteria bacterium]
MGKMVEDRKKHTDYARRWRREHPEAVRAIQDRYAEKHPECHRQSTRKWKKDHPDYFRAESAIRVKERYYGEGAKFNRNDREPWTKEDLDFICDSELSDVEQAKILGRTIHAIQTKRTLERSRRAGIIPNKSAAHRKGMDSARAPKEGSVKSERIVTTVVSFSADPSPPYEGS